MTDHTTEKAQIEVDLLTSLADEMQAAIDGYERVGGPADPAPTTLVEAERSGYLAGLRSSIHRIRAEAHRRAIPSGKPSDQ